MQSLTLGSDSHNGLVLSGAGVAAQHARLSIDEHGHAWLQACDTKHALYLGRQRRWRRVQRVCLCVGDQLRLADTPVSLEQLCRPFGAAVILRPAPPAVDADSGGADVSATAAAMQRPRRNPRTGMLEEAPDQ